MNIKEIAIMIAQGLLLLFFIYLIGLGVRTPQIIENFENSKNVSPQKLGELFAEINENLKDDMNIGKHRNCLSRCLITDSRKCKFSNATNSIRE